MGVWQGVAMEPLKFHLGLPCQTLLRPKWQPLRWWIHAFGLCLDDYNNVVIGDILLLQRKQPYSHPAINKNFSF
jgi:hypothetical protein